MLKNFIKDTQHWLPSCNPLLIGAVFLSLVFGGLLFQEISRCFQPSKKMLALAEPHQQVMSEEALNLRAPLFTVDWFGQYIPVNVAAATIRKSKLDATLVGIFFAPNADQSQALIREAEGAEKIYSVGDKLSGDAVVKRILSNKVIIFHHGALESLSLPTEKLALDPPAKPLQEDS